MRPVRPFVTEAGSDSVPSSPARHPSCRTDNKGECASSDRGARQRPVRRSGWPAKKREAETHSICIGRMRHDLPRRLALQIDLDRQALLRLGDGVIAVRVLRSLLR